MLARVGTFPIGHRGPNPDTLGRPISVLGRKGAGLLVFPAKSERSARVGNKASSVTGLTGMPVLPIICRNPLAFGRLVLGHGGTAIHFNGPVCLPGRGQVSERRLTTCSRLLKAAFHRLSRRVSPGFICMTGWVD